MSKRVFGRWSHSDNQKLLREVQKLGPATHGRSYWSRLASVFPTRTPAAIGAQFYKLKKQGVKLVAPADPVLPNVVTVTDHLHYCPSCGFNLSVMQDALALLAKLPKGAA